MFTSRIIQARSFMSFKEDYVPLKDSLKRMDYFLTLKLQKDKIAQMLIHSLVFDGRFYGAESKEELEDWIEYMNWVMFKKQEFFKSLGVKYN